MRHLPQLDGLRGLAVLMVFLHHAFHVPLLWAGVDFFFLLSGYLITSILLRDRERMSFSAMLSRFYLRRAQRILPAYAVFLLLTITVFHQNLTHLWGYYVFFLQNIPYALGKVSGPLVPLWSLAVEQHFYLIWPIVLFFLPKRWLAPCMVALLLLCPALRAIFTPHFATSEPIYCLTPFRLDAMAAGALAAILLPHCNAVRTIRFSQIAILAGSIAYVVLAWHHPWFRRPANTVAFNTLAYSLNIVILGGVFVWAVLAESTTPITQALSWSPLRALGRISYMLYLLHLGVLEFVQRHITNSTLAALIAFALAVAGATLSWFLIEKPALSFGSQRGHNRAAPATPHADK